MCKKKIMILKRLAFIFLLYFKLLDSSEGLIKMKLSSFILSVEKKKMFFLHGQE